MLFHPFIRIIPKSELLCSGKVICPSSPQLKRYLRQEYIMHLCHWSIRSTIHAGQLVYQLQTQQKVLWGIGFEPQRRNYVRGWNVLRISLIEKFTGMQTCLKVMNVIRELDVEFAIQAHTTHIPTHSRSLSDTYIMFSSRIPHYVQSTRNLHV